MLAVVVFPVAIVIVVVVVTLVAVVAVRVAQVVPVDVGRDGAPQLTGGSYSDAEMLALLDRVLARAETLYLDCSIIVVDQHRIRRRGLPITD